MNTVGTTPYKFSRRAADLFSSAVWSLTDAFFGWLPGALIIGASPALFLWPVVYPDKIGCLLDNKLDLESRWILLAWVSLSAAAMLCVYLGFWAGRGRRDSIAPFAYFRALNRRAVVLTVLPLLHLLSVKNLETRRPFLTLFICTLAGSIAGYWSYQVYPAAAAADKMRSRRGSVASLTAVAVLASLYAYALSSFAVTHHHNFGTCIYDLGIYVNIFWQTIHGNWLGCSFLVDGTHLGAHFDPILILLSPLFYLYPRAETLLLLQSVWLAGGAFPLYLLACRRTGRPWFGVTMVVIYLLYPALHGANMDDFHSLTLCTPLIFWCVYCLEMRRFRCFWFFLALLLSTREDLALVACFLGFYAIRARRARGVGAATIAISIIFLVVAKGLLMTNTYGFLYYYKDLIADGIEGVYSLAVSAATNPWFVLSHVFSEAKMLFFLKLLLPVLFIPLFSGRMWLLFFYGTAFILLASKDAVFNLGFQYSCLLFPFLLAATPRGVNRLTRGKTIKALGLDGRRLAVALTVAMVATSLLISRSYGVFWPNSAFRGGYAAFQRENTPEIKARYAFVLALEKIIPPDASVTASERIGPHLASRAAFFRFPAKIETDWVVVRPEELRRSYLEAWNTFQKSTKYRQLINQYGITVYKKREFPRRQMPVRR